MNYRRDVVNPDGSVLNVTVQGNKMRIGGAFDDINGVRMSVHYPYAASPATIASEVHDGDITRLTTAPALFGDALHRPAGHPNVTCILEIRGTDAGVRFKNPDGSVFAQTGGATYAIVPTEAAV